MKMINKGLALLYIIVILCTIFVSCNKSTDTNMLKSETTHDAVAITNATLSNSEECIVLEAIWNNESESIITYGNMFFLEVKKGGVWKSVPMIDGAMFTLEKLAVYPSSIISNFNDSGIEFINKGENIRLYITNHYEVEKNNEYRVIIEFYEMTNTDEAYQAFLYFTLS